MSLFDYTVRVVGMGNIGQVVAQKWRGAMSGESVAFDPYVLKDAWPDVLRRRSSSLEEVLASTDVVTLHVPLTGSTRIMIGETQLSQTKRSVILINASRAASSMIQPCSML